MIVLGLDVSMTATGWVLCSVNQANLVTLTDCSVLTTEKLESGEKVSLTMDSIRRAMKIHNALSEALYGTPGGPVVDLVVVEGMSWPRNAGSSIKMAMAWGAIAPLIGGFPLIEVGPQELKVTVAGSRSATKKEVEAAVRKRIPPTSSELLEALILKRALREHCWDALGAILASQATEKYRLLQTGMRQGARK